MNLDAAIRAALETGETQTFEEARLRAVGPIRRTRLADLLMLRALVEKGWPSEPLFKNEVYEGATPLGAKRGPKLASGIPAFTTVFLLSQAYDLDLVQLTWKQVTYSCCGCSFKTQNPSWRPYDVSDSGIRQPRDCKKCGRRWNRVASGGECDILRTVVLDNNPEALWAGESGLRENVAARWGADAQDFVSGSIAIPDRVCYVKEARRGVWCRDAQWLNWAEFFDLLKDQEPELAAAG